MKPMKIGEVSKRSGLSIDAIRYYEKEGLLEAPDRMPSGYRQYNDSTVARLLFIRRIKELGFTLKEIRELLGLWFDPNTQPSEVRQRAESKIKNIDEKICHLQEIKKSLQRLTTQCQHHNSIRECPLLAGLGADAGAEAGDRDPG